MSGHAKIESLSGYLDAVLPVAERRRVADHLDACPECRHRLEGLRRVVTGLGRLPTAAPPEDLAARVRREVVLRRRRGVWQTLTETGVPIPRLGSPPIHILALVLALCAIVYLFAVGLEMRRERPTRIVPLSAESLVVGRGPDGSQQRAAARAGESRYLLGGRFHRTAGLWVEDGLAGREPDDHVRLDAAATSSMDEALMQEVAELAALGAPLRLRVGDQVVEIAFRPAAAAGD